MRPRPPPLILFSLDDISVEPFRNITHPEAKVPTYRCPCCGYKTLCGRAQDELCPVCFWQDDGQDNHDADQIRGGPNRRLSLSAARENFQRIGASDERRREFVRTPLPEEI